MTGETEHAIHEPSVDQHGASDDALPQTPEAQIDADIPHEKDAATDGAQGEPHPLEPGGKRFNQVYARAKEAEAKLQALREEKARLEGELEARKAVPQKPAEPQAPTYTWAQLQTAIDEGKITLAQAMEYRETQLRQELERKAEEKAKAALSETTRTSTLQEQFSAYKSLVPNATIPGTEERQKLEREFTYLSSLGYDPKDPRTELLAARAAFGDLTSLHEKAKAKTIPMERDTMQETPSTQKPKADKADPLTKLTATEKKHYQRMIDRGVYPKGWDDVREELLYVPSR